jgi:hypothetical protein
LKSQISEGKRKAEMEALVLKTAIENKDNEITQLKEVISQLNDAKSH